MPFKVKNVIAFGILCSLGTSLILCLLSNRQQLKSVNFQVIVKETSKQLQQLQENIQGTSTKEKKFDVDDSYLSLLFHEEYTKQFSSPIRFETSPSNNGTFEEVPAIVIVSAVRSGQLPQVPNFLKSIQLSDIFPSVVLWDLEVTSASSTDDAETSVSLKNFCNSSRCCFRKNLCSVEKFIYDYPAQHVKDLELKVYRPLIIQTMLEKGAKGGCVLWMDIDRRLIRLTKKAFNSYLTMALNGGIVGWSTSHPTSTLTHPKTFAYFQVEAENFYFHRMIDTSNLIVCNTPFVHSKIMKPWIQCSLTKDCISPVGSQATGCRFDKKPLYRYSGCHSFDSSVLNVALGLAYKFQQPYISRSPISFPVKQSSINQTTIV